MKLLSSFTIIFSVASFPILSEDFETQENNDRIRHDIQAGLLGGISAAAVSGTPTAVAAGVLVGVGANEIAEDRQRKQHDSLTINF